jgi:CRP/FNR family cyclic AMP-dependent transcriptional regulator
VQPGDDIKDFLSNIPVFGGLADRTLDRVISMMCEQSFEVGATVCKEGETGRSMYVVRAGDVVVCRKGTGANLVRVTRMGPGEFFGEMTLIDIQPRSATVVVEAPTVLYALTNRDLYTLYQKDVEGYVMVLQNICRELSRRLRNVNQKIVEVAEDAGDEETQIKAPPHMRGAGNRSRGPA